MALKDFNWKQFLAQKGERVAHETIDRLRRHEADVQKRAERKAWAEIHRNMMVSEASMRTMTIRVVMMVMMTVAHSLCLPPVASQRGLA